MSPPPPLPQPRLSILIIAPAFYSAVPATSAAAAAATTFTSLAGVAVLGQEAKLVQRVGELRGEARRQRVALGRELAPGCARADLAQFGGMRTRARAGG